MSTALPVINLETATFECTFGRGCEGLCCRDGRPSLFPDEQQRIAANLAKFLPHLRPEARELVEKEGFVSRRRKGGRPMLRVVGGWCVFFGGGCVLHRVGAAEGDKFRYKPFHCALFPLDRTADGRWYVRQWGVEGEAWELPCLDPAASRTPAAVSLRDELGAAARWEWGGRLPAPEPAFASEANPLSRGEAGKSADPA